MFKLTLNQRLMLAVLAALLPIAIVSVYQAVSNSAYSQQLIADRIILSALAAASEQREPINAARLAVATLIQNPDIYDNTPRCREIFKEALSAQNALINIIWSDAAGIPRCSVLPIPPGTDFATEGWWKRGVASPKFTLSAPVIGLVSKRPIIIAMQPLFSSSGAYIGAVTAGIDVSWLERKLNENSKTSTSALIGIADANGKIVMSSGARRFQQVDVVKSFGSTQAIQAYDSEQWIYSSAPLYENQLYVVYGEQARPLIIPMRDQFRASVAWPLLAIILTLLAVWVGVNKMVVRWLHELGQVARQFAGGDYSEPRAQFSKAPPEIAEVGADLQKMALAITQRNTALEDSLKTTRAMAREVNHRVKNNLQMIVSLLALQLSQVTTDEARAVLDQTRVRMAALALIHRLLYEKGDDADQGTVDMDRVFKEICHQLHNSVGANGNVTLDFTVDIGNRPVDEVIPVALLATEAITNVYRHAYPDTLAGQVSVTLGQKGDDITLNISDGGIGYDAVVTKNMMGMDLIRAFVEQLDGDLTINAAPNKGVSVQLTYSASRIMRMTE